MILLNLIKLPITTIDLAPGSRLLINDVTWEQYETMALLPANAADKLPNLHY
ncbi:hypothetical protein IQ254_17870 [Nodosilinea sp. LEGE 07088]|uniref:hypothetical protein n=1 Tax=Nodosilinea sp. LEGE 07088 TaxID=2777968 RepID=UPI0018816E27|nr:hypothetical protein [Nodosilinea sp. LEGE 07088]MBE9139038.1 hypothetical protein [Nodosilinea sp. LEGE 07088]